MSTSTRKRKARQQRKNRPHHAATDLPRTRTPIPDEFITTAQIRAHLAAAIVGIHTPIRAWLPMTPDTARLDLPTGAHVIYDHTQPVPLTAYTPCARGAHHQQPVNTPAELRAAEREALDCRDSHGYDDWPTERPTATPTVHALGAPDPDTTAADVAAPTEEPEDTPTAPDPEGTPTPAAEDPDRTHEIDVSELRADHDKPEEHPES